MVTVKDIKKCPIEAAFEYFGRKWTVNLIRDLLMGRKRFRGFLDSNPKLSTRILSLRLRELESDGIIAKKIISKTPLRAEYELTEKGKAFGKVLAEMALFSFHHLPEKVFGKKCQGSIKELEKYTKKCFCKC